MTLSCYIVDDEPSAVRVLELLIAQTDELRLAGASTRPLDALQDLSDGPLPHIVFLDVDMPGVNGLQIAARLQGRTGLIFTTSHREFAPEAFEHEAVDYLLKPISERRFAESIERVRRRLVPPVPERTGYLFVKSGARSELMRIAYEEIRYLSGLSSYVEIHTTSKKYVVYQSLKELLDLLPPGEFSQIHKSYIVNHRFIGAVKGQLVGLDRELLPVGRVYRADFIRKLADRDS